MQRSGSYGLAAFAQDKENSADWRPAARGPGPQFPAQPYSTGPGEASIKRSFGFENDFIRDEI